MIFSAVEYDAGASPSTFNEAKWRTNSTSNAHIQIGFGFQGEHVTLMF
jgi:hypothetical protein